METFTTNSGLPSVLTGINVSQQPGALWRPWTGTENKSGAQKVSLTKSLELFSFKFYVKRIFKKTADNKNASFFCLKAHLHGDLSAAKHPKTPQVIHPVK